MKERPILFSAQMVIAILDGRKTQTRRVIKPVQPRSDGMWPAGRNPVPDCPYGKPSDRLWVKESHSIGPCPNVPLFPGEDGGPLRWPHVTYSADGAVERRETPWSGAWSRKRPSIHMPRWASRITLEVTKVRVERLQAISEADVVAEGVSTPGPFAVHHFKDVWTGINGAGSWEANPWVWVVEFRRLP